MDHENLIGTHAVSSLSALKALADAFASKLECGDIVCLQGDLGSGKTTFVQYVGKVLGVSEEITSPTYTTVAEYDVQKNAENILKVIHIDAYRESLDTNYVHDVLRSALDQRAVVFVEWPQKLGIGIDAPHWTIGLNVDTDESSRIITIGRVE